MRGLERTGASFLAGWVAPSRAPEPGIRFRVYGARVEHTATADRKATHMVFHPLQRDPDATPCTCKPCRGQDLAIAAMGRMWSA